ncbi:hypothetical protein AQ751_10770 [Burkholderia pseudomallei]|nr:hypothetical protein X948_5965 [Burkholderia pseudomallei MSHR5608]OMR43756.1 hypothetical protein AQ724_07490 [Burkholderia pseudomallei]OMR65252.1 hypothetical protein AQ727_26775 [Burkholderia pseudomallei]OMT08178.1 hypothetical protein AQ751_10770 [Burkholderia pseudomallei]ONF17794.1 hypothetical protein AQ964_11210 [Burkholderia pseudomallei]
MCVRNMPMSVKKLEQHFLVQPDEPCDCRDLVSFQKSQLHRSSKPWKRGSTRVTIHLPKSE